MTTETEDITGMTIVFTEKTMRISEDRDVKSFDYAFTSHDRLTADEIEEELGSDYFDIVTCTQTDLVLTSQINIEVPNLQDIIGTITITCTR